MTRDAVLPYAILASWIGALLSLGFAALVRFWSPELRSPWGYSLLGLWTIVPPLWFMWEWTMSLGLPADVKENIKHYHELARNLWLALVVVLAALMGIGEAFKDAG
jgi:hypothetical protein